MLRAAPCVNYGTHRFAEAGQRSAIAIFRCHERKRSGYLKRKLKLRGRRRIAAESHGTASVDQKVATHGCFIFALPQVILVRATEDLPVQLAQVFTRRVLAMF